MFLVDICRYDITIVSRYDITIVSRYDMIYL